jgi:type II secretory pathway component GspD/PulD (secretin)
VAGFGGFRRLWRFWRRRLWRRGVNRTGTTSGSSQYNNNGTVGSANISVDPVTHNIVVIADKETSEQIRKVIASLDAPEPQVLIKVAFVEVDDNKALDLGVQGNYTGFTKTFRRSPAT